MPVELFVEGRNERGEYVKYYLWANKIIIAHLGSIHLGKSLHNPNLIVQLF